MRNCLWFTGELVRILRHLGARGVDAIPYKGPVLAQLLYRDIAARQFSDLDVLVAPKDVIRARTALAELGYLPVQKLTPRQERAYIESGYEYAFDGTAGKNLLELQWRILPRFYTVDLEVAALFDRAREIHLGGESFRMLGAEDLLIVLCVHAAKHVWTQLSWLCDIAQLVNSSTIDWDSALERILRLGIARIVVVNLLLAQQLLSLNLPSSIQKLLEQDRDAGAIVEEMIPIIAQSAHYDTESINYFRLMIRLRENWEDRTRFLWRLTTTPSVGEWSLVRLPAPLFSLYYAVRGVRLARRLLV